MSPADAGRVRLVGEGLRLRGRIRPLADQGREHMDYREQTPLGLGRLNRARGDYLSFDQFR